jgi:hypothetical protein
MTTVLTEDKTRTSLIAVAAFALGVIVACLLVPESADAALRSAAGGGGGTGGGFARFVTFINRLADFTIPIGSAFSVLGLVWGGLQFQAGDARAGRTLGMVAFGLAVVLLSKPVAA